MTIETINAFMDMVIRATIFGMSPWDLFVGKWGGHLPGYPGSCFGRTGMRHIITGRIKRRAAHTGESLGITQDDCKTWHIGSEKILVHLTPAPKGTYDFMLNELRAKYRDAYRDRRCQVPGKRNGKLIICPEHNRCRECPFPKYRDQHKTRIISRDAMIESGYEGEAYICTIDQIESKMQYEEILEIMNKKDPLITQVFEMKEHDGLSNEEIASELGISKRQTYYLYSKALAIGQKYKFS